jgi:hypothetical protein
MDTETAEAVETLRVDIHRVERKVDHVETSLTARIDQVETSLTARIDQVELSLNARIDQVESSLSARIEEGKRHTDIGFETVRDDIRILAEAVVALSTKFDSWRS